MNEKAFLRGFIKESEKIRAKVEAILFKGDKILVGRGKNNKPILPGGGVDPGETMIEAAKRESMEEAGYRPKKLKLFHGEKLPFTYQSGKHKGQKARSSFVYGDAGKKDKSILGADGDAFNKLDFVEVDNLLDSLKNSKGKFSTINKRRAKIIEKIVDKIGR